MRAWPIVRQGIQEILKELIRAECKAEIRKLKAADTDISVDLLVHYSLVSFDLVDGPPQPPHSLANRRSISFSGAPHDPRRFGISHWRCRQPYQLNKTLV
jgi:hypothetical protein